MSAQPTQYVPALALANRRRIDRAMTLKGLRYLPGAELRSLLRALLLDPPDYMETCTVERMLHRVPGIGGHRAAHFAVSAGVPPNKRLGEATLRQRSALLALCERRGAGVRGL